MRAQFALTCTRQLKLSLKTPRARVHSDHFTLNIHQFCSSSNVGVNNGLAHRDLILFLHAVKYCVCACRCVCVSVYWLELIIIRGRLHVYVHVLLALWQAESEWADNEWGVSEALYCMILLYSTPEGRKRRKCSHISPCITVVVCLCESD